MPRKIRDLKRMLKRAGYRKIRQRGSHTIWSSPLTPVDVHLSGNDPDDAQRYQEKDVMAALRRVEGKR